MGYAVNNWNDIITLPPRSYHGYVTPLILPSIYARIILSLKLILPDFQECIVIIFYIVYSYSKYSYILVIELYIVIYQLQSYIQLYIQLQSIQLLSFIITYNDLLWIFRTFIYFFSIKNNILIINSLARTTKYFSSDTIILILRLIQRKK